MSRRMVQRRVRSLALLASLALALTLFVPSVSVARADTVCTITGTTSTETLTGTSGDDVICTNGGDDTVTGNGGTDSVIVTGGGHVNVSLGAGNDRVDASGADSTTVSSGAGNDTVIGSPGLDEIATGDGNDIAQGGSGNDVLRGGTGNDTLSGGGDNDKIWGEVGADTLRGEAGDDIIAGGDGVDVLDGGFGLNNCDYTSKEIKTKTCLYDDDAPKLISFAFSPSTIDSGPDLNRRFSFDLRVTDSTGINRIWITCRRPFTRTTESFSEVGSRDWSNGTVVDLYSLGESSTDFTNPSSDYVSSGTQKDFRVHASMEVPRGIPAGQGECTFYLDDVLGHRVYLTRLAVKIIRSGSEWDDSPPELVSKALPALTSSHNPTTAPLRIVWRDQNELTISGAGCWGYGTYNSKIERYFHLEDNNPHVEIAISGQWRTYTVTYSLPIAAGQRPGLYNCTVFASDSKGNRNQIQPTLSLRRTGTGYPDADPIWSNSTFSNSVVDTGSSDAQTFFTANVTHSIPIRDAQLTCQDASLASLVIGGVGTTHLSVSANLTVAFGAAPKSAVCRLGLIDDQGFSVLKTNYEIIRTPPGLPQAPTSLTYSAEKPTSGVLTWTAPTFPGDPALRDYQISYSTDNKTWKTINDGYSTTSSIPISNLKPNTDYFFKVRGDNGGSSIPGSPGGTWSQVLKVRTPVATAPEPVLSLATSRITSRSVSAAWNYGYNGGAAVTDFVAEVSADNGVTWKTVAHRASTAVYMTISGLKPATTYLLRLRSKNAKGMSEASTTEFRTLNDVPDAPTGLRVTSKDASFISLAWSEPVPNGADVTDYRVEYSTNNGRTWVGATHDPFVTSSATLSGLRSKTSYLVRVAAINIVGVGKVSVTIRVTTL